MTIAPVNIVELAITHRTNESWYLELPVDLGPETTALLAGASARMRLVGRYDAEIALDGAVDAPGRKIVLDSISTAPFQRPEGAYEGDIKLTLASGRTVAPYAIRLSLKQGRA